MAANEVARVYASSLIELSQKKNMLTQVEEEVRFVSELVSKDYELRQFLISPGFSKETKKDFVKKIFGANISEYVINTLNLLIENDRQSLISDVHLAMVDLVDEINNRQWVTVVTKDSLDNATKDKIIAELKNKFKKEILLKEEVNQEILGGIIIKVGDLVIDGSLVKDLKNIRNNLLNRKVRSEAAYED